MVVDVQNDFADPSGSLYVHEGEQVLSSERPRDRAQRGAAALAVYTQDWHPPHTPHFRKDGGIWPVHCVKDTWGAAFHPELVVVGRGRAQRARRQGRLFRRSACGTR